HGYCIGRKACRSRADLFGPELPANPPWDPIPATSIPQNGSPDSQLDGTKQDTAPSTIATTQNTAPPTIQARRLQLPALRQIRRNFFSNGDWPSSISVPFLFLSLILLPNVMVPSSLTSKRVNRLVESLAQGNPDIDILRKLMAGPVESFTGESSEEVRGLE